MTWKQQWRRCVATVFDRTTSQDEPRFDFRAKTTSGQSEYNVPTLAAERFVNTGNNNNKMDGNRLVLLVKKKLT